MQFVRLRLAGFKSFVEAAELHIEPGLTGVVGPNGCGKSNLLEALRWVMGASSAKAMRAGGMDDVIFGGAERRPAREHAEVTLVIDNSDRTAPAAFNGDDELHVSRRIDRGAGSTYRVNGREARARDVQLLFADASTGANSPSLVRQGQISELIAAKPANRRRILEEAAGVSGLHARRHEAELRLTGVEGNLDRLDGVAADGEAQLSRLHREARRAETYKRVAADIRAVRAAVLHARWAAAETAAAETAAALAGAEAATEETAREAARSATARAAAAAALPSLREADVVAAAVLQRALVDRDLLEREAAAAAAALLRAEADMARVAADRAREGDAAEDARAEGARRRRDLAELDAAVAGAPERLPGLEAALSRAGEAREQADAALEAVAAARAGAEARRRAAVDLAAEAAAAAASAAGRAADAQARRGRASEALEAARRDLALTATDPDAAAVEAERRELGQAEETLAVARAARDAAEAEHAAAAAAEAQARPVHRGLQEAAGRLRSEMQGLAQLTASPDGSHPPVLDAVRPQPGYEAALAAALGDDLDAALDPAAPAYWAGAEVAAPAWPDGAEPLSARVGAPDALAARLAFTAVAAREEGARLARLLPAGARLVSREGDLWRWDGLVVRAEAPRPAAVRLAQRARLEALQAEAAVLGPRTRLAGSTLDGCALRLRVAAEHLREAAALPGRAEATLAQARAAVARREAETARREARRGALEEAAVRLADELAGAEADLAAAQGAAEAAAARRAGIAAPPAPASSDDLDGARREAGRAREAEAQARSSLEGERRTREGRARRRDTLDREAQDWARRLRSAQDRTDALEAEGARALAARDLARAAPAELELRRGRTADELHRTEARRRDAAGALAEAEAALAAADRAARLADAAAASARERRAVDAARLEAAAARRDEAAAALREEAGVEPEALRRRLAADAVGLPADPAALDGHLRALEARRDALGAVNLRAGEEAAEVQARLDAMQAERADLAGAIAKLRAGVASLNAEGRERLLLAFGSINADFQSLFQTLFEGGEAELKLVESDDPLEAGLEIYACPPGKRMAAMSLMSGGEQALTATALIFAVFLSNPSPVCVLDEVDAPLDDANVDRFCRMLDAMRRRTATRFIAITHNPVTMSRMDRLFGVTMAERGVSQLVSVDLRRAEELAAE